MDELLRQLVARDEELDHIIRTAEKALKKVPSGLLRVEKNKNTYQYYVRNSSKDTHGTYIKKQIWTTSEVWPKRITIKNC